MILFFHWPFVNAAICTVAGNEVVVEEVFPPIMFFVFFSAWRSIVVRIVRLQHIQENFSEESAETNFDSPPKSFCPRISATNCSRSSK